MVDMPRKILLATDGSEDAALAARAAADLARKGGAELHVAHAWHDIPSPHAHRYIERELRLQGQEILDGQVAALERSGAEVAGRHLVEGRTAEAVLWISGQVEAEMILLGSRGLGFVQRALIGSVSEGVVRRADCPVLVMRGGSEAWPPERVVAGYDGSEESRLAAELAAGLADLYEAELLLVRAAPQSESEEGRESAERLAAELEYSGVRTRVSGVSGDAADAMLEAANGPGSLIALGSRGLGLAGRVRLGSVSAEILRRSSGPVLVSPRGRVASGEPRS